MERVNFCGVNESEFTNGWCISCRSKCQMTASCMVDKRVYSFYQKKIIDDYFNKDKLKRYVENHPNTKFPKYIQEYLKKGEL